MKFSPSDTKEIIEMMNAGKYFAARQYMFPTFNYCDRIIETMKLLFKTESSDKIYKVIEHGCGNGSYAKKVAESVSNIDIIGVELTQAGVQEAKRFENDRLHFLQAD